MHPASGAGPPSKRARAEPGATASSGAGRAAAAADARAGPAGARAGAAASAAAAGPPPRQRQQHPPLRIVRIEEPPGGASVRVMIQTSTAASTQAQLDRLVTLRQLPPLVAATAEVGARWRAIAAPGACPQGMEMWLDGHDAPPAEPAETIDENAGRVLPPVQARLQTGFVHSAVCEYDYTPAAQMDGRIVSNGGGFNTLHGERICAMLISSCENGSRSMVFEQIN